MVVYVSCRNCLFRALGDQLDGTPNTHQKHRQDVVAYMRQHRNDFEPFVEDDVPFERHCELQFLSQYVPQILTKLMLFLAVVKV